MRTEAEVKEAIRHLEEGLRGSQGEKATAYMLLLDILHWFKGHPATMFEQQVIDPCRRVDHVHARAKKAADN